MKEKLMDCRKCGSNACVETEEDKKIIYLCMGCGFMSNYWIKKDEYLNSDKVPKLYKDLIFEDSLGYYWIPANIELPEKGMVFIDGKTIEDWMWSAVKFTPILEDEKYKFPSINTHKADMSTLKQFAKVDFMEGLDYIGYFD